MIKKNDAVDILKQITTDMINADSAYTTIFFIAFSEDNTYNLINGIAGELTLAFKTYVENAKDVDKLTIEAIEEGLKYKPFTPSSNNLENVQNAENILSSLIDKLKNLKDDQNNILDN